jgi:hypothetical protein
MANNIKIVGNILNTTTVSRYSIQDTNLISSRILKEDFGGTGDYIEFYVRQTNQSSATIGYEAQSSYTYMSGCLLRGA